MEKEYEALKVEHSKNLKTIQELETKVASLEQETKMKHFESEADDLDMSFGPRYCKKCGYEAEDEYQLDGHVWSEHEDSDITSLKCQHCDRNFSTLKDLMIHKKMKHIENVSLCWHFSNGACLFSDETCWVKHEINKENYIQTELKSIKCSICGKVTKSRNEFMTHRKTNHEEIIKICNLFKKGQCTYHEKCWFGHRTIEIDGKAIKETTYNHNKLGLNWAKLSSNWNWDFL